MGDATNLRIYTIKKDFEFVFLHERTKYDKDHRTRSNFGRPIYLNIGCTILLSGDKLEKNCCQPEKETKETKTSSCCAPGSEPKTTCC